MVKKIKKVGTVVTVLPKVVEHDYMPELENLAKASRYATALDQNTLKGLYAIYSLYTPEMATEKLKDPTLNNAHRLVILSIAMCGLKHKNALQAVNYVHDRTYGKLEQRIELSGKGGNAIEVEVNKKEKFKAELEGISKEKLDALKEHIASASSLIKENEDERK